MIESISRPLPAVDRGPFLGFVLRRVLRVLAASILIVLLSGVLIVNDPGYIEMARAQEQQAFCAQAHQFSFEDYSPAFFRFC